MSLPRTALLLSATDPNDPVASDVWANIAGNRLLRINNAGRGRQYESGQSVPGRLDADLLNIDEYLNRANTTSPLLNNTELMRRVRWMAVHPADGAGNLVNLLNMRADPSFESYAVGPGPSWLWFFGANAPTVTATGPHSGTRAAVQTVTANAGLQGVVLDMEFIPGDTYTVSIWVNQTAANRIDLAINGHLSTPMASTSATGYTQLVGTFIADQPTLQVCVVNQAPGLAGTVTYDEVQVEQGTILNANPYFETDAAGWFGQGGTIARSTAQAHQGVASLLLTPSGSAATTEVDATAVPIVAGRTHAASAWVYCAVARSVFVTINWFRADGSYLSTATSTTVAVAANTWTLITINTVAPATAGRGAPIVGMSSTPPGSNTLHIDEVTMVSPSAFTTSGPRVRSLWGGHAERLPITWDETGYTGTANLSAVGPLAALAQIGVNTDYRMTVLAKDPKAYWPLRDGASTTTFANIAKSGTGQSPLVPLDSKYGTPGLRPGQSTDIPGNPGGLGCGFLEDLTSPPAVTTKKGTTLKIGSPGGAYVLPDNPTTPPSPWQVTVSVWAKTTVVAGSQPKDYQVLMSYGPSESGGNGFLVTQFTTGEIELKITGITGSLFATTTPVMLDGRWHMVIAVVTQDATNTFGKVYIDGVLRASNTATTTSVGYQPKPNRAFQLGGNFSSTGTYTIYPFGGTLTESAIWYSELTAQDITDLWTAGQGFPGDLPGDRLSRLLGRYYVGATVLDAGATRLGPSGTTDGTKLGQVAQRIVESEYGDLSETRKGATWFEGRTTRFLKTTSQVVFGENVAGGEVPYSGAPTFGYDLTKVANQATVAQTAGTKATASDAASIRSFYQRDTSVQTDAQSSLVAQDHADWLVANRKQPKQRVERITLDPGANPTVMGAVLDLEKGQRCTLIRRPKSANAGAGITMSADYFIENINHRQVDPEKGTWLVDLILSPVQLQPWILGDATYGQLGITTVAGF